MSETNRERRLWRLATARTWRKYTDSRASPSHEVDRIGPRIIARLNSTDTSPQSVPPDAADPALPALYPAIPEPGRRVAAGPYAGSSDALALAQLARECVRANRVVAVVTGDPHSAQRLSEEIPWFAPELRVALFPDWETLPYDHFSPHQDLVSERLATLYRVFARGVRHRGGGGNNGVVPVGAAHLSRRIYVFPAAGRKARCRATARAIGAGRLCPRNSSSFSGGIQRTRRLDRSLSDGLTAALSHRSFRQRNREHQDVRRRYAAHVVPRPGSAAPAGT